MFGDVIYNVYLIIGQGMNLVIEDVSVLVDVFDLVLCDVCVLEDVLVGYQVECFLVNQVIVFYGYVLVISLEDCQCFVGVFDIVLQGSSCVLEVLGGECFYQLVWLLVLFG